MSKRTWRVIITAIATLVAGSAELMAQTGGGATLVGTVRDATGATVAGAKVTVVNTETAFVTEATTQEDGGYYLPYLAPGRYRLKVTASGFKEYVNEGLSFRSAEVPRVDISMELGAVSESVTVDASA